jgi:hypothetical protein
MGFHGLRGEDVAVEHCEYYPGANLHGSDIAFCRLQRELRDVPLVPPLMGCELQYMVPGASVTAVGYGLDQDTGEFGVQRAATSTVVSITNETAVEGNGTGTCPGDSGGPLFVQVPDGDGLDWRVAGILSSGPPGPCGPSPFYYANLWQFVPWLEETSGLDLTPCTDAAGEWATTPRCSEPATRTPDGNRCVGGSELRPFATCGPPFALETPDIEPPQLVVREPLPGEMLLVSRDQPLATLRPPARLGFGRHWTSPQTDTSAAPYKVAVGARDPVWPTWSHERHNVPMPNRPEAASAPQIAPPDSQYLLSQCPQCR